ncbi:hypothetical protein UY3_08047 [Chelonia mydas]|uniref:Ig-like domain-containing protein n=1 Tax=Chelonia mydas TaxID=8469 RepID=M7BA25_CHEMY|nr:hypothetical protein UY3_08047 [Chelonia mydas]
MLEIIYPSASFILREGDPLTLNCTVWHQQKQPSDLKVYWCKLAENQNSCARVRKELERLLSTEHLNPQARVSLSLLLQIHNVSRSDSGVYQCRANASDQTAVGHYIRVNVTVPPAVTLTHDSSGVVVCHASAGKPAAEISWAQGNGRSIENKTHHTNGTVTTLSSMSMINSTNAHVTCLVIHPAMNQTQTIELSPKTTDFIPMTLEPHVLPGNLADNVVVSSVTGYRAVLSCSNMSLVNLISAVWKIRLRDGACCLLAYRADLNKTVRTNCSERMDWAARPDHDPTLQIHPVRLSDEGYYMCEIANIDGSLHQNYTLSVLVPPEVTLTLDISGTSLCKASAGKPAAQISWLPAGDHSTEHEIHTNGTVTVLSTYRVNNLKHEGFSLLLHYLLTGSTISCVIIVTILYCTLQHRGTYTTVV